MKARFAAVVSRFNEKITESLWRSCRARLKEAGVGPGAVELVRVPGAFEIPWAAQRLAASGRFDAVICLGCVLKGRTPQNEYISRSVFARLHEIGVSTGIPCILGIITPDTWAQAKARTKRPFDRGREAATAALEMAELRRRLR